MKDQYVGDINDFEKFTLLRRLVAASGLPLGVCWMLTAPDQTGQGAHVRYLDRRDELRVHDPVVFDELGSIVRSQRRSVRAVEMSRIFANAIFQSAQLQDSSVMRAAYWHDLLRRVPAGGLLFFDPDIGLERKQPTKGRRRSSMYLYYDEVAAAYGRGDSLVVYQHHPRRKRHEYLQETADRLIADTGAPCVHVVWSARIAFLIVPQPPCEEVLGRAAAAMAAEWHGLAYHAFGASTPEVGDVDEIRIEVDGYPPAKNEAKSMLAAGHSHAERVVALLEAAERALAGRGGDPFTGPIGLELIVGGPGQSLSDATNHLGGVGDVLESKRLRGALDHLGPLSEVAVFENDCQIREVIYREARCDVARYTVRVWGLATA